MGKMIMIDSRQQSGTTMIEVLVTIVILLFGLLGLAGLQARLQVSEVESYQRAQALILLNDMASRISANRTNAGDYVTTATSPLGSGTTCPATTTTLQQRDSGEWCQLLQGSAETISTSSTKVGALIGGRGCIELLPGSGVEFLITVTWKGMDPISAPPSSIACGKNAYDSGSSCTSDKCRRYVSTVVRMATL
jgi:type IV pilus assembly protein PilV